VGGIAERSLRKSRAFSSLTTSLIYLQSYEEDRDDVENIHITPIGVVESGCVNQNDVTPVELERLPRLYGIRAGF